MFSLSILMQPQTADDDSVQECLTIASGDDPVDDDSMQDGQEYLTVDNGDDPVPVYGEAEEDPKLLFTSVTISDTVTAKEPGSTGEYTLYVIEVSIHVQLVSWVSSLCITCPYHDNRFCVRTELMGVTFAISLMVSFLIPFFLVFPCLHLSNFIIAPN